MAAEISVLIIDDNDAVRKTLAENLAESGFQVIAAKDGFEAMDLINGGKRPDVVVTDLIMPRKEGLEIIIDIRRNHPGIIVIAISGGGRNKSVDFLQMAERLGADATMPKPVNVMELDKKIRALLAERKA